MIHDWHDHIEINTLIYLIKPTPYHDWMNNEYVDVWKCDDIPWYSHIFIHLFVYSFIYCYFVSFIIHLFIFIIFFILFHFILLFLLFIYYLFILFYFYLFIYLFIFFFFWGGGFCVWIQPLMDDAIM